MRIFEKILYNYVWYKLKIKHFWWAILEACGIIIFEIYDEDMKYYTKKYYFYNTLSFIIPKCILDKCFRFPQKKYTVTYLCDNNFYKYSFTHDFIQKIDNSLFLKWCYSKKSNDETSFEQRATKSKYYFANLINTYPDIYYKIKLCIDTYKKELWKPHTPPRFSNVISICINGKEYTNIIRKYIPPYGMYDNDITLFNIVYDANIKNENKITIIMRKGCKLTTMIYIWSHCKDKHLFDLLVL
jgi:hypothetical protein